MTTFVLDQAVVCVLRRTRDVTAFSTGRVVDPDAECPMCRNAVLLVELAQPERRAYDWPRTAPLWLLTPHEWNCHPEELAPK